jgi:predicted Zn-dependent protease
VPEFLEELKYFPQHARARAGLAIVYQANGQREEAERTLQEMTRLAPTPDSFALAARVYAMFGDRKEADAMRAEGRRAREIKN